MTPAERITLYVTQKIEDEEAVPSRTKILKILYLIDVEYFRRHRKTLTGWQWVFYKYGPYVFDFPATLEKLNLAGLDETEDRTEDGRKFFRYRVSEDQDIDDLVSAGDQLVIDNVIKKWALEDINLLLNYVYFETEPMKDATRGEPLDFSKIPALAFKRYFDWGELAPSPEMVARMRQKLSELRTRMQEEADDTRRKIGNRPFVIDETHIEQIKRHDKANTELPEGVKVISSR
jgi:hypothetical protein